MAEIINLKRARKRLQRQDDAETASANRIRFGRMAVQRTIETAAATRARTELDGAKLGPATLIEDEAGPGTLPLDPTKA